MKINLEKMVDVCAGVMSLKELNGEIYKYMYWYSPKKMVIDITKNSKLKKYYTSIYIPIKDFEKLK